MSFLLLNSGTLVVRLLESDIYCGSLGGISESIILALSLMWTLTG
jgi:hypothetical protein